MHILEPCRKYILCDATIKWVCPLFLGRKILFHQRLNCRVVSYLPLWTQNFFGMCLCAKRLYFGGCFIGKYIPLSTIHWHTESSWMGIENVWRTRCKRVRFYYLFSIWTSSIKLLETWKPKFAINCSSHFKYWPSCIVNYTVMIIF